MANKNLIYLAKFLPILTFAQFFVINRAVSERGREAFWLGHNNKQGT